MPPPLTNRVNDKYSLQICSEPFTNIHRLIRHGSTAHSSQAGVRCPYCGQTFASAVALSLHLLVAPTLDMDKVIAANDQFRGDH